MRPLFNGTILSLALLLPMVATAATVTPSSYSYTGGTPAGEACCGLYQDAGLTKLTDGNTGTADPTDGTWVGWQHGDTGAATITFLFASTVTINNVSLDFLRSDGANTQLPDSVTIGGTNFATTNFATDNTKGFVTYSGSWTGSSLVVTLNHPESHWIFVNEAQFTSDESTVPEPASLALVGMALGGLLFGRKRFQS
jgi:hypothetical protein